MLLTVQFHNIIFDIQILTTTTKILFVINNE